MQRPRVVTAIGILFILAGAAGFVYHFQERPVNRDWLVIEAIRMLAVVGGVFLLMGRGWARWLVLAWLAFHVGIGALDSLGKFGFHLALLLLIGYALLRPPASEYFRAARGGAKTAYKG